LLFLSVVGYALYGIWCNAYFTTGDGPCHLHNAQVWRTMVLSSGKSFYDKYYALNPHFSANYLSHALLALFQIFVDAATAEKILASTYIIFSVYCLSYLAQQMHIKYIYLVLIAALPLLLSQFFYRGYYNYIFGLSLYFLVLGYSIKCIHILGARQLLVLSSLCVLLCCTHAMPFAVLCMSLLVLCAFTCYASKRAIHNCIKVLISLIPSLAVFWLFSSNQSTTEWWPAQDNAYWTEQLQSFSALVSAGKDNRDFAKYWFYTTYLALLIGTAMQLVQRKVYSYQAFVIALCMCFVGLYYYIADVALGGEMVKLRFQCLVGFMATLLLGVVYRNKFAALIITVLFAVLAVVLIRAKNNHVAQSSKCIESLMLAEPYLKDATMALPLSYHATGIQDGKVIDANVPLVTNHAGCLLQREKKIVFASNYQGGTAYFPLLWQPKLNPFIYLDGIEKKPPQLDLVRYNQKVTIDALVLFNLLESDRRAKTYEMLQLEMRRCGYQIAYTAPDSSVLVYTLH
jgi:hypothetical protein